MSWCLQIKVRSRSFDYTIDCNNPLTSCNFESFKLCTGDIQDVCHDIGWWFIKEDLPEYEVLGNDKKKKGDLPLRHFPREGEIEVKLNYCGDDSNQNSILVYDLPFGNYTIDLGTKTRTPSQKTFPVRAHHVSKDRGLPDRLVLLWGKNIIKGVRLFVPEEELPEQFKSLVEIKEQLNKKVKPKIRFNYGALENVVTFNKLEPPVLVSPQKAPRPTIVPESLVVSELRAELKKRGLEAKGSKSILIDRLTEAIQKCNQITITPTKTTTSTCPINAEKPPPPETGAPSSPVKLTSPGGVPKSSLRSPASHIPRIRPIPFSPLHCNYEKELLINTRANNSVPDVMVDGKSKMPEELTIPQLKKEIIARGGKPLTGLKRNLVNQLRFLLNEQCPQVLGSDEETKTESDTSTSEESKKPILTPQSLGDSVPDITQASEVKIKVVSFSQEPGVVDSESIVSKQTEMEQVKVEVKEIVQMEVEKVETVVEKKEEKKEKKEEKKKTSKKRKRALAALGDTTGPSTSIPKRKTKKRKTKEDKEVKGSDSKVETVIKTENVVDSCKMDEVKSIGITGNDLLIDHSSKDDQVKDIPIISEEEKVDEIEIEVIVEEDEIKKDNKQVQEQLGILIQKWDDLQTKITHLHEEQNELKEMIDKIAIQINN